jgi:hypothetical protein
MSIQLALKLPWHPPQIVEHIRLCPDAGQLTLSTSTHRYMVKNRDEEKAKLNQVRVDAFREREAHQQSCCTIRYDGDVLNMLVGTGHILDAETDDTKEVGKAISDMIAEAAQHWKAEH